MSYSTGCKLNRKLATPIIIEDLIKKRVRDCPTSRVYSMRYSGLRAALLVSFCSLKTPLSANHTSK